MPTIRASQLSQIAACTGLKDGFVGSFGSVTFSTAGTGTGAVFVCGLMYNRNNACFAEATASANSRSEVTDIKSP